MNDNSPVSTSSTLWFGQMQIGIVWCVTVMLRYDHLGKFKSMDCRRNEGWICGPLWMKHTCIRPQCFVSGQQIHFNLKVNVVYGWHIGIQPCVQATTLFLFSRKMDERKNLAQDCDVIALSLLIFFSSSRVTIIFETGMTFVIGIRQWYVKQQQSFKKI